MTDGREQSMEDKKKAKSYTGKMVRLISSGVLWISIMLSSCKWSEVFINLFRIIGSDEWFIF